MPKETFLNLPEEKKQHLLELLLEKFYDRPVSQVKVSEIVEAMNMSRGAFYKYFQDLEDAYTYTVRHFSQVVHQDILTFIQQNEQDFFLGIEKYLAWCCESDRESTYWRALKLLTHSSDRQAYKRRSFPTDSPMTAQWLRLLEINTFLIDSVDEAISFLYFIMSLVMTALTDSMANDWTKEELIRDFRYRTRWLLHGIKQA
ncbi:MULTISPECIES: TetR/AcrR family transcriptional regulator [unclassified Enterococcus]|uniref:TetR/AcrR family transcriptional regulator n=1 Tax=unclassified Enterococcus TaxID=2608891 RepID=UPI0013EDBFC8|nr:MULTISPECIES: TetR/AcrR family transcriptional regulator [unclassified Enterococcus]